MLQKRNKKNWKRKKKEELKKLKYKEKFESK